MADTPEKVERVARAVREAWPSDPPHISDDYQAVAVAAIEAHEAALAAAGLVIVPREPTQAMIDAGRALDDPYTGPSSGGDAPAEDHYRAMITAALGEPR